VLQVQTFEVTIFPTAVVAVLSWLYFMNQYSCTGLRERLKTTDMKRGRRILDFVMGPCSLIIGIVDLLEQWSASPVFPLLDTNAPSAGSPTVRCPVSRPTNCPAADRPLSKLSKFLSPLKSRS
jgi:hypothetical protein